MKVISSKKGFTLVEIMIVVAIIGIIIAIAVPAFIRARENARGRACQENLSKIDGAKEMYALEEKQPGSITPSELDLVKTAGTGYLKSFPKCPATVTAYSIRPISSAPSCAMETKEESWATKHTLSGEAATVTAPPGT